MKKAVTTGLVFLMVIFTLTFVGCNSGEDNRIANIKDATAFCYYDSNYDVVREITLDHGTIEENIEQFLKNNIDSYQVNWEIVSDDEKVLVVAVKITAENNGSDYTNIFDFRQSKSDNRIALYSATQNGQTSDINEIINLIFEN